MKKESEDPSAESLAEIPETADAGRYRRRPGRGHHAHLHTGDLVQIDSDLWPHFGSAEAVNKALREVVEGRRRTG